MSYKAHMNGGGESYSGIIPAKQLNKSGRPPAEVVEGRSVSSKRLACSVGDRPTGVRVRNPVAWIAGGKETELLEPIDKAIFRMVSKSSGRNANKPIGDLEILRSEGRAPSFRAKAAWIVATDRRGEKLRRGGRDSTMTRAR
jgi:hypothetical protein